MGIVHSKHSIIVSYYDFGRLLTSTGKTDWKQIGEAEERSVSSIWGTLNLRWFLTSMQKWKFQGWWSLMGCHLWGRTVGHNWSNLAAAAAAASYRAEKLEVCQGRPMQKKSVYRVPEKERGMQKNCPRYLHWPLLESLSRTMSHMHRVKFHNTKWRTMKEF